MESLLRARCPQSIHDRIDAAASREGTPDATGDHRERTDPHLRAHHPVRAPQVRLAQVVAPAAGHSRDRRHLPAHRAYDPPDLVLYAAAIGIGAAFGVLATRTTRLERDPHTQRLYTHCGIAFALTWLVALGSRVAFVWALQDSTAVRQNVGDFMRDHQIVRDAIAPTFVLIALSMFMLRLAVFDVQALRLTVKASRRPAETVPPGRDRTISSR